MTRINKNLLLASIPGALGQLLKQPLIVMFILLGVIAEPSVPGFIKSNENMHLISIMRIFVLLFIAGLSRFGRFLKELLLEPNNL